MEVLQRGAEALVFREAGIVIKARVPKGYRIPELDGRLRKARTRAESRLLSKASRAGISVPRVLGTGEFEIRMEFIEGKRLKELLGSLERKERTAVSREVGKVVAALHNAGIMHGDLTTSNMLLSGKSLFLIDFGLARASARAEDHAIDLFLLYESLKAGHFPLLEEVWGVAFKTYKSKHHNPNKVLGSYGKIMNRRRYKGG